MLQSRLIFAALDRVRAEARRHDVRAGQVELSGRGVYHMHPYDFFGSRCSDTVPAPSQLSQAH